MVRYSERPGHTRLAVAFAALLVAPLLLTACGTSAGGQAKGRVQVAYAGSLVNIMEHKLGPAFERATGYSYEGKGAGSVALANQIKDRLIQPDVFISASAHAYAPLEGAANGNIVSWYLNFAATSIVIGYSPTSPFAGQLRAAAAGTIPWYQVLRSPELRLGRTDPALDPKGVNTLFVMQLAERYYQQPGLAHDILGNADNAAQIFPEEDLVARLSSGQLDAGFFYLNEVKDAGLPYITLPAQINLGDPAQASFYAQASYTTPQGKRVSGAPVLYSLTIPATARNQAGAVAFVQYVLGSDGEAILRADGIQHISPIFEGDAAKVPSALAPYTKG